MAPKLIERPPTDVEMDMAAKARLELMRLQREHRMMEGTRHGYASKSGMTVTRNIRILETLRQEKIELMTDLENVDCERNHKIDKMTTKAVTNLMRIYDKYQQKMKDKICIIKEEASQVDKIVERIFKQKLQIQMMYGSAMKQETVDKKVRILENRLHNVTTQYDTRCARNDGIREKINLLLMERLSFHSRYVRLKNQIARLKAGMLRNVIIATQHYDSRDDDVSKMKALRERDVRESKAHVLEVKELKRILHHDEKGHLFLVTKNLPRKLLEGETERKNRKEQVKELNLEKLLAAYKESVKTILKIAGYHDVNRLCVAYKAQEQSNYTRFQYISNLNHECQVLQEEKEKTSEAIENVHSQCEERKNERIESLAKSKSDFISRQKYLASLYRSLDYATDAIQKDLIRIEEVFTQLNCDTSPLFKILGNRTGLNLRNLKLCLGIMEKEIKSLMWEKRCLEVRKKVEINGENLPAGKQFGVLPSKSPNAVGGPFKPSPTLGVRVNPPEFEDEDRFMGKAALFHKDWYPYLVVKMKAVGLIGGMEPQEDNLMSESTTGIDFSMRSPVMSEILKEKEQPPSNAN